MAFPTSASMKELRAMKRELEAKLRLVDEGIETVRRRIARGEDDSVRGGAGYDPTCFVFECNRKDKASGVGADGKIYTWHNTRFCETHYNKMPSRNEYCPHGVKHKNIYECKAYDNNIDNKKFELKKIED